MNCYIISFISMLFHCNNTSEITTANNGFSPKNTTLVYATTPKTGNITNALYSNYFEPRQLVFEKKTDTLKPKSLKITASAKKETTTPNTKPTSGTSPAMVVYKIFFDGRIEKHLPKSIKKGYENKYQYVYLDKFGQKYVLGIFTVYKTPTYRGTEGSFVNLINLEEVPKYFKKNQLQYLFKLDSKRSFVNEQTLASFLGAMLEVNYLDIGCNGFSHSDGSSRPSRSHINGNNGDFKYLRTDKEVQCGSGTSLNLIKEPQALDFVRQNKWNNALYKFGWKNFLGWSYTSKGKRRYLDHIPKNTANHFHHLHVQGYEPNFKEIRP
ncbi:hypothetical protein [Flavobacterium crassostreae]|uniref:Uncharacterized protein n=1 Tax=Flavobacterium crassostreae TaxID=1763534 RepID=A0A1B9E2E5_9FLAO|nr:hypothetical protein [Flavobacterium crassostreae]OCB76113.1 hypothetical protein LPBF_07320 [Flavobacterium crassostreae]